MRIAQVITVYPPCFGGAGVLVSRISRELSRAHEVAVYCGALNYNRKVYEVTREVLDGIPVTRINIYLFYSPRRRENYNNPGTEASFKEFLEGFRPDVVHFHAVQGLGANLIEIALRKNIKVVLTMHDWWWMCPHLFLSHNGKRCAALGIECDCLDAGFLRDRNHYLRNVLSDIKVILCPSVFLRESLINLGFDQKKLRINENGVYVERTEHWKRSPSEKVRFTFFGGTHEIKGYNIIMGALDSLKNEEMFTLKIYGAPIVDKKNPLGWILLLPWQAFSVLINYGFREFSKRVYDNLFATNVKDPRVQGKVQFLPVCGVEDLAGIYAETDVVLVPSIMWESFSLVTREAAVFATPVITTENGGANLLIKDGVNGLVMETFSPGELAEKMRALISDRGLLEKLRANMAKTKVRTIEDQVKELEEYFTA